MNNMAGPIRVPGTYPPEWLPDQEADSCMSCDNTFTLIKRRHHCRACGKIFCSDCCDQKAKLLYLDNKEARVCNNCHTLIKHTLTETNIAEQSNQIPGVIATTATNRQQNQDLIVSPNGPSTSSQQSPTSPSETRPRVHGVLKTANNRQTTSNDCSISNPAAANSSSSSSSDQQSNKQVMFSDGIRPGTDLSESYPYPIPSSSSSGAPTSTASFSLLTRQNRTPSEATHNPPPKERARKSSRENKNVTVCDEIGYLPPVVISKDFALNSLGEETASSSSSSSLTNMIASQFRLGSRKSIQDSMESRGCPLNGVMRFEEISSLTGVDDIVTFLLLKDFYLKVKLVRKDCCVSSTTCNDDMDRIPSHSDIPVTETCEQILMSAENHHEVEHWCFLSDGLSRFGQKEVMLVIDRDIEDHCIPRAVFKIYLTLHELSYRRQTLENLGNLLFQDGLFGYRDTAGLIFVQPLQDHCLKNLIIPSKPFLVALVLQRWEVPWSKVFPMRLLLRLGHKSNTYPYPIISYRTREPVYYEVGHTIISILGDFRNFRYSLIHVEGLKVMINKMEHKVVIKLDQSCYQQFNKVLDSSSNEHVLAWSSCPFPEADGHLISVQNDDGHYDTVEFYKRRGNQNISFGDLQQGTLLGASFIIFSGALKINQSGQPAKITIVEDGLLIQIQSCTMAALKNAIHYMHHFDIDCENDKDVLNRVEIDWQQDKR